MNDHTPITWTQAAFRFLPVLVITLSPAISRADELFKTTPAWGVGWPYNTVVTGKAKAPAIGRVDIDSDLDYNGVIANDGKEGGDQESSPPGLIIGHKQMSKIVFRVTPFSTEGQDETDASKLVCSLEIRALNQSRSNGIFPSEEAAAKASGHLKIWADEKRSRLLLDSRDKNKCRLEWKIHAPDAPAFVYAECVEPSSMEAIFSLMLNIDDTSSKTYAANKISPYTTRDWMLITCRSQPQEIKLAADAADARRLPGHGNYYGFSKLDKDGVSVWLKN